MNDELKTKEYLHSLESLKLADSTRLRMREDLLQHSRFHTVSDIKAPVKSPFAWLALKPVQVAFSLVLIIGASSVLYINNTLTSPTITPAVPAVDTVSTTDVVDEAAPENIEVTPTVPKSKEVSGSLVPASEDSPVVTARSKSAPATESVLADDSVMSTMLSQGTWTVAEQKADITLRVDTLKALLKKYDAKFSAGQKTLFNSHLNQAESLLAESEGKDDVQAHEILDKATAAVGEVESELSLLGRAIVEEGIIVDIDFSVDPTEM